MTLGGGGVGQESFVEVWPGGRLSVDGGAGGGGGVMAERTRRLRERGGGDDVDAGLLERLDMGRSDGDDHGGDHDARDDDVAGAGTPHPPLRSPRAQVPAHASISTAEDSRSPASPDRAASSRALEVAAPGKSGHGPRWTVNVADSCRSATKVTSAAEP